ncbi:Putative acyltransferase 3 domain-containing protein [Septoria linicola]|uniref:Acyltransferase 3 domain-containing protein n=1 Tax=Septoria linicola TaxID=215465 RepID=A0A9Q9ARJ9_9PEZI|nr:Putative acyltransferase 3 domain-containing protein [Septoria linicola]
MTQQPATQSLFPREDLVQPFEKQHSPSSSISDVESFATETSQSARPLLRERLRNAARTTYTRVRPLQLFKRLCSASTTPPIGTNAPRSASRTASYDGLRGIACLIVFNFHFLYPYTKTITHGFGVNLQDVNWRHPHQLPILCLLVRGRAMVTLFFAISGYVLSHGFLSVRSVTHTSDVQQVSQAFSRLSSLALRRWMRLYLPATFSMLLVMFGAFFGAFDAGRDFQDHSPWLTGWWEQHPPRFSSSFAKQLRDFAKMWWEWSTPFQWRLFYSEYDPHTWTIPVEFRGSMVLFVLLLASAGLKRNWRVGLFILVTVYCFASKRWDVAAFTGGALVAEIHIWQAATSAPVADTTLLEDEEKSVALPTVAQTNPLSTTSTRSALRAKPWRYLLTTLQSLLFILALYILSFPDDAAEHTPGFRFLNNTLTPQMYKLGNNSNPHAYTFWHAFSAIFIIYSIRQLRLVNKLLCMSVPQYLGKISYALYLVHGPLLHSAGFPLQVKIFEGLDVKEGEVGKWVGGLMIGWLTMLSLSIVVAHFFWKVVDVPLVRFAKGLERVASRSAR